MLRVKAGKEVDPPPLLLSGGSSAFICNADVSSGQERRVAIREWLRRLDLAQYADTFERQAVDVATLPTLTADDLKDLGVELVGHRRRLLEAIAGLRSADPAAQSAEPAERRTITVLFCDLVGSTELAGRHDPEDLRDLMAAYQRTCAETIAGFGGHVARYMGDGLLAYYGYPHARENGAESALRAGLALVKATAGIAVPGERLAVRVGIATGLVVVGDLIGQGDAAERTVVGETPNLAARLQGLAGPNQVLCADRTRRLAAGLFEYDDLGECALKGFSVPVRAWRVTGESSVESRFRAIHEHPVPETIGRVHEVSLLLDRWATAKEGEGQVVLIAGDSGIGKSRLIQDFIDRAGDDIRSRFEFQCQPHFRGTAFSAVVHQLEAAAGLASSDEAPARRDKLVALLGSIPGSAAWLPDILGLMNLGDAAGGDDGPRQRILAALVARIEHAAATGPTLCVLEDAHWVDPSTQDFVTALVERIVTMPVLLLVSYRLDYECPWIQCPHATSLKLNRLSRAQAAALVRAVAGDRQMPAQLLEDIVDKTDGVPLFLEEVTKMLLENMPEAEPDPRQSPTSGIVAVPDTLHDTLLSRLDRDEAAKHVAQVASAIGRVFEPMLLARVADMPETRIEKGLEALVRSGLIKRDTVGSEVVYAFRHGLLHEVTYGTMLLRRRRDLHRRIAAALVGGSVELAKQRPELVARHYDAAADFPAAAEWWLAAGRHALRQGSYGEALVHLEAGLGVIGRMPAGAARSERELAIQVAIAETCRSARFSCEDRALEACRRARELSEELSNLPVLLQILRLEFGISFNRPDLPSMERVGREFERLSRLHDDGVAAVLASQTTGCVAFFKGNLVRARQRFRAALAAADRVKETGRLSDIQFPITALTYLSWSELLAGQLAEARRTARRAVSLSREMSRFAESLALANTLVLDRLLGDEEAVEAHLARLREIAEARGIPYWTAQVGLHDGFAALARGEIETGLAQVRKALATFAAHAVELETPFYLGQVAELLVRARRHDAAAEILIEALAQVERTGERWYLAELLRLRAEANAAEDPAAAEADLRRAVGLARSQGALLLELRAATGIVRVASGGTSRRTEAAALRRLVDRFDPGLRTPDLAGARTVLGGSPE